MNPDTKFKLFRFSILIRPFPESNQNQTKEKCRQMVVKIQNNTKTQKQLNGRSEMLGEIMSFVITLENHTFSLHIPVAVRIEHARYYVLNENASECLATHVHSPACARHDLPSTVVVEQNRELF